MSRSVLLVGLGNPGARYLMTRHNLGFIFLDFIASEYGAVFSAKKDLQAEIAECHVGDVKLILLKPQTYMNLSGKSLTALYQKKKHLREHELIVAHDEVEIPPAHIRIKKGGGDAGHNGLKSLREHLGSGDFCRFRLGVGKTPRGSRMDLADYVLQRFSSDEESMLANQLNSWREILEEYLKEGLQKAQDLAGQANHRLVS